MRPPWSVGEPRWCDGHTGGDALGGLPGGARVRLEIDDQEPGSVQSRAAVHEQRACAGEIAVGEMLPADGDLDQPLQRLARLAASRRPVGLEHLVDLEVEAGL